VSPYLVVAIERALHGRTGSSYRPGR
jgi:hypothetical protein